MRATKRKAVRLESMVQSLSLIKVDGMIDERQYARRKLSNGLTSRYQAKQKLGKCDNTDIVLGGRKVM